MRRLLRFLAAGLLVVLAASSLVYGCSSYNDARGRGDAPIGKYHKAERQVWAMPDKFPNVAGICFGPDLVLVTTRDAAPVVVEDAPPCAEDAP